MRVALLAGLALTVALALVVVLVVVTERDARACVRTVVAVRLVALAAVSQVALGVAAVFFALPTVLVTLHLLGAEALFLALLSVRLRTTAEVDLRRIAWRATVARDQRAARPNQ